MKKYRRNGTIRSTLRDKPVTEWDGMNLFWRMNDDAIWKNGWNMKLNIYILSWLFNDAVQYQDYIASGDWTINVCWAVGEMRNVRGN
jgi:hypothetical protein